MAGKLALKAQMQTCWLGMVLVLAGCTSAVPSPSKAPPGQTSAVPGATASTADVEGSDASSVRCGLPNTTLEHQVPDLEALLPATVAGRSLARWSVRGRCWLEGAVSLPENELDGLVSEFETADDPGPIALANLTYGAAGREDTRADPPYFVFGAGRPKDDDEVSLALFLLLGGAAFDDPAILTGDLTRFESDTIGGKEVYVGSADMIDQTEHQRGRPFLYQTDDFMFVVITDDDAWAADAIGQLP
jgi:hypothetical protein